MFQMWESPRAWIAQWPRALSYVRKGRVAGSMLGVTFFVISILFFSNFSFQIVLFQSFSVKFFSVL